ncbi:hypothetical protein F1C76_14350 [Geodermatophilaceae bacterium NBWT11]|nr:hypothetical protein F1C76_14350 [Geodermatophilaceae bacterium NBWT11]
MAVGEAAPLGTAGRHPPGAGGPRGRAGRDGPAGAGRRRRRGARPRARSALGLRRRQRGGRVRRRHRAGCGGAVLAAPAAGVRPERDQPLT